jgi:RNA polymerase sigma-70 factor (ECF subfamily)
VFLGSEAAVMEEGTPALPAAPVEDPLVQVVRRLRTGEVDAFEELMARTEGRILALAWRLLGDRHLAEDAAQETYLRIFRSLDSFRLGDPFEPWMIRIAVNVCRDQARRRGPLPLPAETLDYLEGDAAPMGAEEAVLLQQRRAMVQRALADLPQAERAALVLRDLEGLATEEVARVLGVRPVTVRSQVASARSKLQAFCSRWSNAPQGGRP